MKKQITISIDIDTETEGKTYCRPGSGDQVYVRKDIADCNISTFAAVVHELGHILAFYFGMPASLLDPRNPKGAPVMAALNVPYYDCVYQSEEEAWYVAQQMFNSAKQWALDSYKRPAAEERRYTKFPSIPWTQDRLYPMPTVSNPAGDPK